MRLCSQSSDQRDDQERNAERGRKSGARRIGRLRLQDARGQHADLGRRAEHGRYAELLGGEDEHQQCAGDDRGRYQRQRHPQRGAGNAGAGRKRGLFQRRVHGAQRACDHQEHDRRFVQRLTNTIAQTE